MRALLVGVLGFMAGAGTVPVVSKEVRTEKLVVVDESGTPRAIISTAANGMVLLTFHGTNQATLAALGVSNSGGQLLLADPAHPDRNRVILATGEKGSGLMIFDAEGKIAKMVSDQP